MNDRSHSQRLELTAAFFLIYVRILFSFFHLLPEEIAWYSLKKSPPFTESQNMVKCLFLLMEDAILVNDDPT